MCLQADRNCWNNATFNTDGWNDPPRRLNATATQKKTSQFSCISWGAALHPATCAAGCSLTPSTPLPCSNPKQRTWKRQKEQMYLKLLLLHIFFQPPTIFFLGDFLTLVCLTVFGGYQISSLCLHGVSLVAAACRATSSCTLWAFSGTPSHLGPVPDQSTPTHSLQASLDCVNLHHIPLRDWFSPNASDSWQPHWPPLLPIRYPWVFPW